VRLHGSIATVITSVALASACSSPEPSPSETSRSPSASATPEVVVAELLDPRPVVHPSGAESYVNPGMVVQRSGRLHMLTNSFTRYPGRSFVTHLVSADGIAWETVAEEPVLENSQVPDALETFTTAFLTAGYREGGGSWVAYGYTFEGQFSEGSIWRASAPALDGQWKVDSRPALQRGDEGSWDSLRVAEPSVVRTDEELLLFYTGFDEDGVGRIGLATSTDGTSWTKHDGPVFEGVDEWDGGSVGNPQVVETSDGLVMAYRTEAGGFAFGLARSSDGVAWETSEQNPIMTEDRSPKGEPFWQSEAAVIGGEVRWWLEVGIGSDSTDLYAYRLDLSAAW
jgi:hypothetical protein